MYLFTFLGESSGKQPFCLGIGLTIWSHIIAEFFIQYLAFSLSRWFEVSFFEHDSVVLFLLLTFCYGLFLSFMAEVMKLITCSYRRFSPAKPYERATRGLPFDFWISIHRISRLWEVPYSRPSYAFLFYTTHARPQTRARGHTKLVLWDWFGSRSVLFSQWLIHSMLGKTNWKSTMFKLIYIVRNA